MKTYWDHSEQDRALLSADQVRDLLKFELMEKGVVNVEPLDVTDPEKPKLPVNQMYTVKCRNRYGSEDEIEIAFASPQDVTAFLALNPYRITSSYDYGSDNKFTIPIKGSAIEMVNVSTENGVKNMASELKEYTATIESNRKLRREHEEAVSKIDKATEGVWLDWRNCQNEHAKHLKVKSTYQDYVTTCEGDVSLATRFLGKAYEPGQINAAFEWFGEQSPLFVASLPQVAEA